MKQTIDEKDLGALVNVPVQKVNGYNIGPFEAYLERQEIASNDGESNQVYVLLRFATPSKSVICCADGETVVQAENRLAKRMASVYDDCLVEQERGGLTSNMQSYLETLNPLFSKR